jgi:hypothetical protein
MLHRRRNDRQTLLLFGVLAILLLSFWGRAMLQSPEEACHRAATPRLVGGFGPTGTVIKRGAVVVRTEAAELSADGQRATVSVSDGCNSGTCTERRSLWGWTVVEGPFWSIVSCGNIDYEYE